MTLALLPPLDLNRLALGVCKPLSAAYCFLLTINALVGVAVSGNSPPACAFSLNSDGALASAKNDSGAALADAKLSSS